MRIYFKWVLTALVLLIIGTVFNYLYKSDLNARKDTTKEQLIYFSTVFENTYHDTIKDLDFIIDGIERVYQNRTHEESKVVLEKLIGSIDNLSVDFMNADGSVHTVGNNRFQRDWDAPSSVVHEYTSKGGIHFVVSYFSNKTKSSFFASARFKPISANDGTVEIRVTTDVTAEFLSLTDNIPNIYSVEFIESGIPFLAYPIQSRDDIELYKPDELVEYTALISNNITLRTIAEVQSNNSFLIFGVLIALVFFSRELLNIPKLFSHHKEHKFAVFGDTTRYYNVFKPHNVKVNNFILALDFSEYSIFTEQQGLSSESNPDFILSRIDEVIDGLLNTVFSSLFSNDTFVAKVTHKERMGVYRYVYLIEHQDYADSNLVRTFVDELLCELMSDENKDLGSLLRIGVGQTEDEKSTRGVFVKSMAALISAINTKKTVVLYDQSMSKELTTMQARAQKIASFVNGNDHLIKYSPQFDNMSKKLIALVGRPDFNDDDLNASSIHELYAHAAKVGLVTKLARIVYDNCFRDAVPWGHFEGFNPVTVIPLPFEILESEKEFNSMLKSAQKLGLQPNRIEFEMCDAVLECKSDTINQRLEVLKDKGFRVSIYIDSGYFNFVRLLSNSLVDKIVIKAKYLVHEHDADTSQSVFKLLEETKSTSPKIVLTNVRTHSQKNALRGKRKIAIYDPMRLMTSMDVKMKY